MARDIPIERSDVPPSLRVRSAMSSIIAKSLVGLVVEHEVEVPEMPPDMCQWKFFVFT